MAVEKKKVFGDRIYSSPHNSVVIISSWNFLSGAELGNSILELKPSWIFFKIYNAFLAPNFFFGQNLVILKKIIKSKTNFKYFNLKWNVLNRLMRPHSKGYRPLCGVNAKLKVVCIGYVRWERKIVVGDCKKLLKSEPISDPYFNLKWNVLNKLMCPHSKGYRPLCGVNAKLKVVCIGYVRWGKEDSSWWLHKIIKSRTNLL